MIDLYKVFPLSLPSDQLKTSFSDLPSDRYLKGDFIFRERRLSKCVLQDSDVLWRDEQDFLQSKNINSYLGDIKREYPAIKENTKEELSENLLKKISALFPKKEIHFGVHQMRTIANDTYSARPAPEGIHQDGFDFVGIYSVQESNVNGGLSILVNSKNHNEVVFEDKLAPGEFCIFNDRDLAHYVTPFTPKYPGVANRDVFVFTIEVRN